MRRVALCVLLMAVAAACGVAQEAPLAVDTAGAETIDPTPYEPTFSPEPPPPSPVAPKPSPTLRKTSAPKPVAPRCHPSYKGACLKPDASDYDCAGGSGNGPYYVQGPIQVVGPDEYDLDRDGDGVGCQS